MSARVERETAEWKQAKVQEEDRRKKQQNAAALTIQKVYRGHRYLHTFSLKVLRHSNYNN